MLSNNWMMSWTRRTGWLLPLFVSFALMTLFSVEAVAAPPPAATTSYATTVPATGLGQPDYFGDSLVYMAVDQCGNYYAMDSEFGGELFEVPAGGGAATYIAAPSEHGAGWESNQILIMDTGRNNLYLSASPGNQVLFHIPIVNCALNNSAYSFSAWTNIWGAPAGSASNIYYWGPTALAVDAAGNLFAASWGNAIFEVNLATDPSGKTETLLTPQLSATITAMTIDANNNILYAQGGGIIYELPFSNGAYASTAVTFASGYSDVVGLALDSLGNLYVTDAANHYGYQSVIYEIPNEGTGAAAALNPADQSILATEIAAQSPVAIDLQGNLIYGNWDASIHEVTLGKANAGTVAAGSSSTTTIDVSFNASVTPATIAVIGSGFSVSGGSCATGTAYTVGQSCTVKVNFAPTIAGAASGVLTLADANGDVLATANLAGIGTASGITIDPGTITAYNGSFTAPTGAAVDSQGNVFFADSSQNAVLEVAAKSTTPVALGSGLSAPTGVAVDSVGNVYVADTGNNQIVKIPVVNGALSTAAQTTLVSSTTALAGMTLNKPAGIAVDGLGDLYIADSSNKRVLFVPYANGLDLTQAAALGTGMSSPSAIALDASGDVFVTDAGNGNVYELTVPLSSNTQFTVASGYKSPSGLAIDPSGALFVVDSGNQAIWRIPDISGTLTPASSINVVGELDPQTQTQVVADPYGVAIDSIGNLYVSDEMNAKAYMVNRIAGTKFLGFWTPGSTGTAEGVNLESSGNSVMTLSSPFYSLAGDTAEFTPYSSAKNACASGAMASGSSCSLEATFTPAALAGYSEIYTISSDAANTNSQPVTATFTGTGFTTAATTTNLVITSPTGTISYDQSVTVQVNVASVVPTNGIPPGKVQFLFDGGVKQTAVLDATGAASYTFVGGTNLLGGSHTFSATYLGDLTPNIAYSQSSSSPIDVTIQTVATNTSLAIATAYLNPASQQAGTTLALSATVGTSFAGTPTGTVTFVITDAAGGTPVTLPVTINATDAGVAKTSYTLPAPISSPSYDQISVVATYSGDSNFAASGPAAGTFDLTPAAGTVSFAASSTSLSSSISSGGKITFTPTTLGGWTGIVGYNCLASSLPEYARCVWSPGQVQLTPSIPGTVAYQPTTTLTITIDQPPQTPTAAKLIWWIGGLSGLVLLFVRRRWMRQGLASFALLAGVVLLGISATGLTACGGINGIPYPTPSGSHTITVYATADPFTTAPTSSTPTPATSSCGVNSTTGLADPSLAPCSQQTYQIALTVQ